MSNIYVNPHRNSKNASQQETVKLEENTDYTKVNSYQKFNINNELLEPLDEQLILKSNTLKQTIEDLSVYNSFLDIGASNGYFTFLSKKLGFKENTILEHDTEYTDAIKSIIQKYSINNVNILNKKFNELDENKSYNVVCMLALIHWIYSCTEINGTFDSIIKKLANITKNVLIIEWIDEKDPALKVFNHLSYNNENIKENYCEENFVKSIKKYFNSYTILPTYKFETRKIYIVYKDYSDNIKKNENIIENNEKFYRIFPCNSLDNGTSHMFITLDKKYILKKPVHYLDKFVYEREIFWFEKLSNENFIPKIIYKNDNSKFFITTYFGDRINVNNKPNDWKKQLTDILDILRNKYNWDNPDLKHTEILVSPKGKLGIVDFGWCKLNNSYECEKGFTNNKFIDPPLKDVFELLESKFN